MREDGKWRGEGRKKRNWVLQCLSKRIRTSKRVCTCVYNTYGKGGHPPPLAHSPPHAGVMAVAEELGLGGGGHRGRVLSSEHFNIWARAFEVAGVGVCSRARGGTYLPVGKRGVRHNEWCGVRGAIDSSFNLVATHPSSRPESCRAGGGGRGKGGGGGGGRGEGNGKEEGP